MLKPFPRNQLAAKAQSLRRKSSNTASPMIARHTRDFTWNRGYSSNSPWKTLRGVYMRKLAPARVSYRNDFLISYRVYMMTGSFHISLFEGTLHVDKIQVWFKIANITHALPVPVYRQTDFTPKRVVVSLLHDAAARFRTGVKFSPRYKNRSELTPGWLAPAWNLWWYRVNKYRSIY